MFGAKPVQKSIHPALLWLRAGGVASICLGGIGLMEQFFWLSNVLVDGGLVLLAVDLCLEPALAIHRRFRATGIAAILLAIAAFSYNVTFARAPVELGSYMIPGEYPDGTKIGGITWRSGLRDLRVTFRNPTDDDYQDLDLIIHPGLHGVFITEIGQVGDVAGVTFLTSTELEARQGANGVPSVTFDATTGHTLGDLWKFRTPNQPNLQNKIVPLHPLPDHYRLHCEKLPHRTTLVITIAVANEDMPKPVGRISSVGVKGQYRGGFRVRTIDQVVDVSN